MSPSRFSDQPPRLHPWPFLLNAAFLFPDGAEACYQRGWQSGLGVCAADFLNVLREAGLLDLLELG